MTKQLDNIELINEIRGYISETILIGVSDQSIEPGESFLQRGILDSTGVMELVGVLEDRFGITVNDDEITPDNLDSLHSISLYLQRKRNPS